MISARDVADSAGLPRVWFASDGYSIRWAPHHRNSDTLVMDLSDPQTAFGVALKLDAWERAGATGENGWVSRLAEALRCESPERLRGVLEAMAARIRHIAMDHRIRRALGWEVAPGTLATLNEHRDEDGDPYWKFTDPHSGVFAVWCLAGITDKAQALEAIHAEVCR